MTFRVHRQIAKEALDMPAGRPGDQWTRLRCSTCRRHTASSEGCPQRRGYCWSETSAQLPPIGYGLVFHVAAEGALASTANPSPPAGREHRHAGGRTRDPQRLPELPRRSGLTPGVTAVLCAPNRLNDVLTDLLADLGGPHECQISYPLFGKVQPALKASTLTFTTSARLAGGLVPGRTTAENEPVLWTVNDWKRGLMNGSLGRVLEISSDACVWTLWPPARVEALRGHRAIATGLRDHGPQGTGQPIPPRRGAQCFRARYSTERLPNEGDGPGRLGRLFSGPHVPWWRRRPLTWSMPFFTWQAIHGRGRLPIRYISAIRHMLYRNQLARPLDADRNRRTHARHSTKHGFPS